MRIMVLLTLISLTISTFSQVKYIAHRGASFIAPENTMAAVNLAWQLNADAVEVDVYLSQDNQVMVCHDDTTLRTSGIKLVISKSKAKLLRKLDVGSWKDHKYAGEKMPYLTEVINSVPEHKMLVVEIKCGKEILPYLKEIMDTTPKASQLVFISFGWETILETKKTFPNNKCYWLSAENEGLSEKIKEASQNKLDGINLYYEIISPSVINLAKHYKLDVLCWTVDDPVEAKKLIKLGVSGITTNRPAWLKEQVGRK
ncbi:glycerophosphodiester phosphodiesterase family protein [Saccharicrinis sp. FJH54]|uniref:glycerophosphodiester phosphodiesterase family protein n=1 Tax=Saccharicrinis sp. FJH54 TaxID=3344665 RepID=UPI0035D42667